MANKVFRWVGSGNTGATSSNIFNWNHPGNWEVRTYLGAGPSGDWQFIPTSYVPGPFDTAIFGQPTLGSIGISKFGTLSKVKSPCLFGGFKGTVAGGTWTNAGLCGSAGGVTYTSALKEFRISNTVLWQGDTYNFDGMTYGGKYKSYNDTVYAFNNLSIEQGMPFGGGLFPSTECLSNLIWVRDNYPNMGIVITEPSEGNSYSHQITVPGYTAGAGMEAITIKCYDTINISQIGSESTSPINLKVVGAYVPLSRNFGATGYTGNNAPEVITKVLGFSSKNVEIYDGMFAYAYLQPSPSYENIIGLASLPNIWYKGNMTTLQFQISCLNRTEIAQTVKFKDAFVYNSFTHQGFTTNSNYNIIDKTLNSSMTRGAVIRGSQFVNDVYATLYPGNTISNAIDIGQIIFDPTINPFRDGNGIKRSALAPGVAQEATTLYAALKRSAATRCSTDFDDPESANLAMGDLMVAFPEDDALYQDRGFAPGSHILEIGVIDSDQGGTTLTQNLETINVSGEYPGMETPVVNIVGNVKINDLYMDGGLVSFFGHEGTARIANLRISEKSTLDLRGGNATSQKYFGLVSSSGVCGGVSNLYDGNNIVDNGGNIFLESGQRLFNVSTTKGGRITTLFGSTDSLEVSDSLPPSISTKSKP